MNIDTLQSIMILWSPYTRINPMIRLTPHIPDVSLSRFVRFCFTANVALLALSGVAAAEVVKSIDPETELPSWKLVDESIEIRLSPRLPAGIRAFFEARGFPLDVARDIGDRCVMWTVARNSADEGASQAIKIKLEEWAVTTETYSGSPVEKSALLESWNDENVTEAARVAFKWATFPSEQLFLPGDHIWGMTLLGPPPGTTVDLRVVWSNNDTRLSTTIKDIECGKDL